MDWTVWKTLNSLRHFWGGGQPVSALRQSSQAGQRQWRAPLADWLPRANESRERQSLPRKADETRSSRCLRGVSAA